MLANMVQLKRRSLWIHPITTCRYLAACTAAVFVLVLLVGVVQRTTSSVFLAYLVNKDTTHFNNIRLKPVDASMNDNDGAIQQVVGDTSQHARARTVLKTDEVPVVFWDQTRDRDIRLYVVPDYQTAIIQEADFCPDDLFLLVFVSSAVEHFEHRDLIRKTWASGNRTSSVKVLFMLGDPRNSALQGLVEEESKRHGDVIQENFVDNYYNMTLKVTMMLKWIDSHCSQISYLLKTDDDIFVDLDGLLSLLRSEDRTGILIGNLFCNEPPHRDPTNKWYCPRYLFNGNRYPSFLSGPGYVMSADVIRGLYRAALDTPFFHLDDVFFTGILAQRIGVVPYDHVAFYFRRRDFHPLLFCHRSVLLYMLQSNLKDVEDLWELYKATKLYCSELDQRKHLFSGYKNPYPRRRTACP